MGNVYSNIYPEELIVQGIYEQNIIQDNIPLADAAILDVNTYVLDVNTYVLDAPLDESQSPVPIKLQTASIIESGTINIAIHIYSEQMQIIGVVNNNRHFCVINYIFATTIFLFIMIIVYIIYDIMIYILETECINESKISIYIWFDMVLWTYLILKIFFFRIFNYIKKYSENLILQKIGNLTYSLVIISLITSIISLLIACTLNKSKCDNTVISFFDIILMIKITMHVAYIYNLVTGTNNESVMRFFIQ